MRVKGRDKIAKQFAEIYFNSTKDYNFIRGQSILHIHDYFFNLRDIKIALRYDITKDRLFYYYDYVLDEMNDVACEDKKILSLRKYYKFLKNGSLERRLKEL